MAYCPNDMLFNSTTVVTYPNGSKTSNGRTGIAKELDSLHKRRLQQRAIFGIQLNHHMEHAKSAIGVNLFLQKMLSKINDELLDRPVGGGVQVSWTYWIALTG